MRARFILVGILTFCLSAIVVTCRQTPSTSRSVTDEQDQPLGDFSQPLTNPASASSSSAALPRKPFTASSQNPKQNQASETARSLQLMARPDGHGQENSTEKNLEGAIATITANDPNAEVNVRSLPTVTSDPIGYGIVGDAVALGQSDVDPDGGIWYHVTFQESSTVGWIRSDLLDIQTPPERSDTEATTVSQKAQSEALNKALDERCGDARAVEAYFITQSHTVYVCKTHQQRHYLSQEHGTQQVITTSMVEPVGGGYIINNGNFEYHLDSSNLTIIRLDDSEKREEILQEPVIYSERF